MISSKEMRKLERFALAHGIIPLELMENAGKRVVQAVSECYGLLGRNVVVFAGTGNNGGDGLVAARHFAEHCPTLVLFFGDKLKLSEEARENYEKIREQVSVVEITKKEDLEWFRFQKGLDYIFVDALLGIGVKGELHDPTSFAIDYFNQQQGTKVAVDVPSGVNPDTGEAGKMCECDLIVTFHDLKTGLEKWKEKTIVVDIGIPDGGFK